MNAAAKIDWINARLAEGRTIYVTTYTQQHRITQKAAARNAAENAPMFKADGDALMMLTAWTAKRGKVYSCADAAKITAR